MLSISEQNDSPFNVCTFVQKWQSSSLTWAWRAFKYTLRRLGGLKANVDVVSYSRLIRKTIYNHM